MFYPVESLKRGGRFYLCWVADSWPLRFATITRRQLWSQDIRKICDDLLEVITIESGQPARRFSLRLSSQLMRGLARIYQRKVTDMLSDLCMINAHVSHYVNKKLVFREIVVAEPRPQLPLVVITEAPENEERVEDIIQRSTNMVAHIDDITLREPTLPEQQPLLNDNFGELNPEQPLQLLADKSLEMMMAPNTSIAQQSLELIALEQSTDKSRDRSHLLPHAAAQMERISAHDLTLYRKSVGEELLPMGDIEKEVPELPDITAIFPEPPVPQPDIQIPEEDISKEKELPKDVPVEEPRLVEPEVIVLEDLEEGQPQAKRRRFKNKMVDKNTKLTSNYLRARIANVAVELRCEDSVDDVIKIRVPADILFSRPAHAGHRVRSSVGYTLTSMFIRNLGVVDKRPLADREIEETETLRVRRSRVPSHSVLQKTVEAELPIEIEPQPMQEQQPIFEQEQLIIEQEQPIQEELNLSQLAMDTTLPRALQEMDISDLPTQVIPTLSQARKRSSEYNPSPKRRCHSGYVAWRQQKGKDMPEADKENIPDNIQQESLGQHLTLMLQGAGLADITPPRDSQRPQTGSNLKETLTQSRARRIDSDSSETPLGSLDRTKVSLGDSVTTTDSKRFIRDEWGTEGTMIKILYSVKAGIMPLDMDNLLARGPQIPGHKRFIAARCFTSILKLRQHAFINITKNPETLEITDITLGPKFDDVM